jgi:hypothetical protein
MPQQRSGRDTSRHEPFVAGGDFLRLGVRRVKRTMSEHTDPGAPDPGDSARRGLARGRRGVRFVWMGPAGTPTSRIGGQGEMRLVRLRLPWRDSDRDRARGGVPPACLMLALAAADETGARLAAPAAPRRDSRVRDSYFAGGGRARAGARNSVEALSFGLHCLVRPPRRMTPRAIVFARGWWVARDSGACRRSRARMRAFGSRG